MKTEDARYDMKKGERVRDIETALPPLTRSAFDSKVVWFVLATPKKKSLFRPSISSRKNWIFVVPEMHCLLISVR